MWPASNLVAIFVTCWACVCCHNNNNPPNIVFIMIDDVGWNDVGYHGSSISTPHMDTLAKEGTKLENYYVAHLCSPSRGMFLTGKHMIHLGMEGGIIMPFERKCLPVNEATIAQELKLKNYSTHAIGKWHVGYYKKACLPNNRGFDTFFGIIGGCADHYTHKNTHWWELYRNNISIAQEYQGHYSTDLYAREATNVIRNHDASKPMFMYLAFQAAHLPLQAPRKYIDMYSNIEDPDRRVYAAMVTCMDDAIGNVVDQLREAGLWNNTVLIVSTDNGGAKISGNNWPLKGSKASLWEGGVRGVAFVTSPFLADHVRGTSNHQLMHVTDWFPTMLHVAGVYSDVIKSMTLDGVNQWNTISENRQTERNDVLINLNVNRKVKHVHYEEPWLDNEHFDVRIKSALRLGNWKLLTGSQAPEVWFAAPESDHLTVEADNKRIVRLYNIAEDETESTDLSESRPDKVLECLKKLSEYHTSTFPVLPKVSRRKAERLMPNHIMAPWDLTQIRT